MVIQHNLTAMNAWRQTGINNRSTSKSLEKLASGFKINRAADDASGLGISEKMRGQIRGTMMGTQNTDMGINLVQTAEGALNETHAILQRMRELSVQSSNGTYHDQVDRENLEKEYQALKSEVDRIAESTHYNGIKLIDGSQAPKNISAATYSFGVSPLTTIFASESEYSGWIDLPPVGYSAGTLADAGINASRIDSRGVMSYSHVGATTIDLSQPPPSASRFGASTDIILTWNTSTSRWDYYGAMEMTSVTEKNTYVAEGSFDPLAPNDKDSGQTTNGIQKLYAGIVFFGTNNENNLNFITFYDDTFYIPSGGIQDGTMVVLRDRDPYMGFTMDPMVYVFTPDSAASPTPPRPTIPPDTPYSPAPPIKPDPTDPTDPTNPTDPTSPIKPTSGSLIIQYGANSPDNLRINISDMRAAALGIDSTSISKINFANNAISDLDSAINLVSTERANLGAFQNRLETIVRDNEVKTENLQAAESTIRDVDMAKEMMAFTKNNILAQAAQSMLAQANQLPQGVLQLLR